MRLLLSCLVLVLGTSSVRASGQWVALGPEGGEASALVIHPDNPDLLYAAGPNGVFKSEDGGANWLPSSQGLSDCRMTDLVMHPGDPQVLFAASREGGVFKSPDGGQSWMATNQGLFELRVTDLEIHPSNPQVIYAATRDGIFKSQDGGQSWQDRSQGFFFDFFVQAIKAAPSDPSLLYAATLFDGIFISTDGAESWLRMPGQSGFTFGAGLAVHPSDPERVFAVSSSGFLRRTADDEWQDVCVLNEFGCSFVPARILAFRDADGRVLLMGSEDGLLQFDLESEEVEVIEAAPRENIAALAISLPALAVSTFEGISLSLDQGESFGQTGLGLRLNPSSHLFVDPVNPLRINVATPTGAFRSLDGGESWNAMEFPTIFSSNPTPLAAVYTDPSDFSLTVGMTQTSEQRLSTDGGATWERVSFSGPGGFIRQVVPNYESGSTLAVASFGVSVAQPRFWTLRRVGLEDVLPRYVVLDSSSGDFWLASDKGLLVKVPDDEMWRPLETQPQESDLWSVALGDGDSQLVLAGGESGLYVSHDKGASWSAAADLPQRRITAIEIDRARPQRILVATWGEGVWESLDGALSFQSCGQGLESQFVSGVKAVPGAILAATQGGVSRLQPQFPPGPAPSLMAQLLGEGLENTVSELRLNLSLPPGAPALDHSGFEMIVSMESRFEVVELSTSSGRLTMGPQRGSLLWDGRLEPGEEVDMRVLLRVPDLFQLLESLPFSVQGAAAVFSDEDGDGAPDRMIPAQQKVSPVAELDSTLLRNALAIPARPVVENGFVGLALTNPSFSQESVPLIRELAADGSLLQPRREDSALPPFTQIARNSAEIAQGDPDTLVVDLGFGLHGFFLIGDNDSQRLDGVGAQLADSGLSFIPEVILEPASQTHLFLFNPDEEDSTQVTLSFHDDSGTSLSETALTLQPLGSVMETLRDLLPDAPNRGQGYLRLNSSGAVRSFALQDRDGSFSTLAASVPATEAKLWLPHFVVDPSLQAATVLNVVNLGGAEAEGRLVIRCDHNPFEPLLVSFQVPANGRFSADLAQWLPQDGETHQGSLQLTVQGGEVLGQPLLMPVVATATIDGGVLGTRSSIPFSTGRRETVIVQQLAHSPSLGIFQGLAAVATGQFGILIITVIDSSGQVVAESFEFVGQEGDRLIGLLSEFDWDSLAEGLEENFDITGGWIAIDVRDAALISLFGGPNFLAAVEPVRANLQ